MSAYPPPRAPGGVPTHAVAASERCECEGDQPGEGGGGGGRGGGERGERGEGEKRIMFGPSMSSVTLPRSFKC